MKAILSESHMLKDFKRLLINISELLCSTAVALPCDVVGVSFVT